MNDRPETIDVPPVFWNDHSDRGCADDATVLAEGKTFVRIKADLPVVAELYSDAKHYASSSSDYGPELFGLCSSARATVNRLTKAFPDIADRYLSWHAEGNS